mgnify:CR=1 FL=1
MDNEKFLQPSHAAKLLDVTTRTLFTWEEKGKIKAIRTSGGHRRYILSSFPNYQKFIKQKETSVTVGSLLVHKRRFGKTRTIL